MNRPTSSGLGADRPASGSTATHGKRGQRALALAGAVLAAALFLVSLKFPLWQMHLEAPQYRGEEALQIFVHPNAMHGDLRELSVLNTYIGVHIPPTLPQFRWLPATLVLGAVLVLGACLLPIRVRRRALVVSALALTAALATAAVQAKSQIYHIGHNRDQHTPLAGVRDFTPPFLGTSKIAQFEVSSRFGLGAWMIGGALALQFGAAWLSRKPGSLSATEPNRPASPALKEPGRLKPATTP